MKIRLTPQTLQILEVLLHQPLEWKYGYEISRQTGLKSGTLYPILMRLAERELLETAWEAGESGKPPRHVYRFTSAGLQLARAHRASPASGALGEPILHEAVLRAYVFCEAKA